MVDRGIWKQYDMRMQRKSKQSLLSALRLSPDVGFMMATESLLGVEHEINLWGSLLRACSAVRSESEQVP